MKRKVLAGILTTAMIMTMAAGCGNYGSSQTEAPEAAETQAAEDSQAEDLEEADTAEGRYTIGISQFAEHGSLDNCREGFLEGLKEAGIEEGVNLTVEFENAQADTGTAGMISDNFVSKKVDMICAIATPSAMSAYNSCLDKDIPVVYTAVSDPVSAGLADKEGNSVGNVTGTSDKLPVEEQLKMIREMMPEAQKVGILYTTSEANSVSTIEEYKEIAPKYDFEIVESGINTVADVEMAAKDLVSKVDCISNMTDNTVVSALQTVIAAADEKNIPVFGSEIEQVKSGCLASMGIDYIALGKQTGAMAAKILKGEAEASDMPYEVCSGASLYVNTAVAEKLGFDLEDSYMESAAEVFDEITVE
ncbi:MAG: ABC transporter substrate-binding protein [Lachnospiraceae bacterium]|nr:ABC transporter substrate-binding protein [Lachnospiraceae bacterium]